MINYRWGQRLRQWLRQPHVFTILDRINERDAEYDSWSAGGCRVLACALHATLPRHGLKGTATLKVIASSKCAVEHVVLKVETPADGVWYLDADGVSRERTLLARFARRERLSGLRLTDYDDDLLDEYEIQCPPLKLARLITALESALPAL